MTLISLLKGKGSSSEAKKEASQISAGLPEQLIKLEHNVRYLYALLFPNVQLPPSALSYSLKLKSGIDYELTLDAVREVTDLKAHLEEYFSKVSHLIFTEEQKLKLWQYLDGSLSGLAELRQKQDPIAQDFESAKDNLQTILLANEADGVMFKTSVNLQQCYKNVLTMYSHLRLAAQGRKAAKQIEKEISHLRIRNPEKLPEKYTGAISLELLAATHLNKLFVEKQRIGKEMVYTVSQPCLRDLGYEMGIEKSPEQEKTARVVPEKKKVYVVDEYSIFSAYYTLRSPFDNYEALKAATEASINNRFSTQEIAKLINVLHIPCTSVITTAEALSGIYHSPELSNASFKEVYHRAEQVRKQLNPEPQVTHQVLFLEGLLLPVRRMLDTVSQSVKAFYQKSVPQQPASLC